MRTEVADLPLDGVERIVVGAEVGSASAVKMSTASVYKGTSALLAQALLAADANGVLEHVLDDLRAGSPELVANVERRLANAASKSGRYVGEMHEIASTQEAAGLTPALFEAMGEVFSFTVRDRARANGAGGRRARRLVTRGSRPTSNEGKDDMTAGDMRERFRALHERDELFVMPNPWDIGSARLLTAEGFEALATTSQGFAWALGKQDQTVTRDELVAHVAELAAATPVPLNVDSERCYPDDPGGIAETVSLLAEAGAAGLLDRGLRSGDRGHGSDRRGGRAGSPRRLPRLTGSPSRSS